MMHDCKGISKWKTPIFDIGKTSMCVTAVNSPVTVLLLFIYLFFFFFFLKEGLVYGFLKKYIYII